MDIRTPDKKELTKHNRKVKASGKVNSFQKNGGLV